MKLALGLVLREIKANIMYIDGFVPSHGGLFQDLVDTALALGLVYKNTPLLSCIWRPNQTLALLVKTKLKTEQESLRGVYRRTTNNYIFSSLQK